MHTTIMLKRFTQSLEDPQAPLLGPNIWLLFKSGLLLPNDFLGKVLCIISQNKFALFVLTQFIEIYVVKSNLDMVLTNLKISMMTFLLAVKGHSFIYRQKDWKSLISYITDADQIERNTRDSTKRRILDAYTNYCRRITYSYWFLVNLTLVSVVWEPLFTLYQRNFRETLNCTVPFPHIYSTWLPFNRNHNPGMTITVIWQLLICTFGAFIVTAYDTIVIVIMVFFCGKLDLLRESCKHMLGSDGVGVSDEQAIQATKELHTTHVLLTKNYRLFNSLLSPVMFLYVVVCSIMLSASVYQLTLATTTTETLIMLWYLVYCLVQLFMLCWHSNEVLVKSGEVAYGPYESQWSSAGLRQRRLVLLLAGQLRLQYFLTAGPFTNLTLPTFLKIVKGAYSYYTLLRK